MIRKYVTLAQISMQNSIAYRSSFIINIVGSLLLLVSMMYLWKAIYAERTEVGGFTWEAMKAYLLITFISNSVLSYTSEGRIAGKIRDGSVSLDLLKPLDFQKARFAETLGTSLFEGTVTILLTVSVLAFFSGVQMPAGFTAWLLFAISLLAALLVKFGVVYLAGLCCFWTDSYYGISLARAAITNLLSGALAPLAFFPDWLKSICLLLPFQGIVHIPASIYLGQASSLEAVRMVAVQLVWGIVLWLLGKLLWSIAVKKVTIHGG
ncbi:ABC transporter permease [Paenibacillus radicis (ex Xue et al. 2023)]|uniref:ABC-2 family transporter protein n=1 Tax=Paenibacillus radicis (ex Xue et al. 2023) TaxID=2972489 RepID=A0ABT1YLD4_9BACL|nr:ABC-2 family transporter protein [Paenibacillus radicis (ex Xue et al. 2023)]MCR8633088.1 ABC-2 family transporter protein [Paenibacillus radicis (ex Xue et al. 2023)]